MGDRTSINVYFREEYQALVIHELIGEDDWCAIGEDDWWADVVSEAEIEDGCVHVEDYEANYGEAPLLTAALEKLKIPYNRDWGNGGDYISGDAYARYDEQGELMITEVYEGHTETALVPPVLSLIEKGSNIDGITEYLKHLLRENQPYGGEFDLTKIPLRKFTPEESAIIMKFKMGDVL